MVATTTAMATTAPTIASAMVNLFIVEAEEGEVVFDELVEFIVEAEEGEVVFDELVEEADVGPNRVLVVADAEKPLGVVFAVFRAGSAVNPLAVQ
jgi:hypothetical protein